METRTRKDGIAARGDSEGDECVRELHGCCLLCAIITVSCSNKYQC